VPAEKHDLVGSLAPPDFADHVGGWRVGSHARLHPQAQHNLHAAILKPLQTIRIFNGDGCCGNPRRAFGVIQCARVRRPQAGWADRADQRGHRSKLGRFRCPRRAVHDGLAIRGERDVIKNDAAFCPHGVRLEILERFHD
jgi:hypothetical protein